MATGAPGDELRAPDGSRMVLVMTPGASGGRRLEIDWFVPVGSRLVAADHLHPGGPEVWRVVSGRAGYRLAGEDREADAPYEYTVPAGTSHGHPWNAGATELNVRQIIDSPDPLPEVIGGVQAFFETSFAFSQAGDLRPSGDVGGRLQNALTIHDLLLGGTYLAGPPRWAQRMLLGALAVAARATGKRPYRAPEFEPASAGSG